MGVVTVYVMLFVYALVRIFVRVLVLYKQIDCF